MKKNRSEDFLVGGHGLTIKKNDQGKFFSYIWQPWSVVVARSTIALARVKSTKVVNAMEHFVPNDLKTRNKLLTDIQHHALLNNVLP
jgi:hypothetical protein